MPPYDEELAPGQRLTQRPRVTERWREGPNGIEHQVWSNEQGRFIEATPSNIAPEYASLLADISKDLDTDVEATRFSNMFLQQNSRTPTGSLEMMLPGNLGAFNRPDVQSMINIQNRFVRGNIQPGTSGAGNSGAEQIRIERTGPAISNTGPANRAIDMNLRIDRDLRTEQLRAAADWARSGRGSVEDFNVWWARRSPQMRTAIQRRYEATNGPVNNQAYPWGAQRPNPFGSGVGAMAGRGPQGQQQQQRRRRYNPETGQIE
jgi:hypothetical protein